MPSCYLALIGLLLCSMLVGCTNPEPPPARRAPAVIADGPPLQPHADLTLLPDLEPRTEQRSKYGNPDSYTVHGKTYQLLDGASGYEAVGNASWYGRKFHGRRTSSGEAFDMYQLSAAHRSLPIPVFAEVTNLDNNRSTVVRINDRGPFHNDRLIDLSYAAAVKLGFHQRGTARVRVRVIEPPAAQAAAPSALPPASSPGQFFLQAGAFSEAQHAEALRTQLAALSQAPTFIVQVPADRLFKVRLGPFADRSTAQEQQRLLAAADHPGALILSAQRVIRDGACLPQC